MNVSCCLVSVVLSAKNSTSRKRGLDNIFLGAFGFVWSTQPQIKENDFKNVLDRCLTHSSLTFITVDCA